MRDRTKGVLFPCMCVLLMSLAVRQISGFAVPGPDTGRQHLTEAEKILCTAVPNPKDKAFRGHGRITLAAVKRLMEENKTEKKADLKLKTEEFLKQVGWVEGKGGELSGGLLHLVDGVTQGNAAGGEIVLDDTSVFLKFAPMFYRNYFQQFYNPSTHLGYRPAQDSGLALNDKDAWAESGAQAPQFVPSNLFGDGLDWSGRCTMMAAQGPGRLATDMADMALAAAYERLSRAPKKEETAGHVKLRSDLYIPEEDFKSLLQYLGLATFYVQVLSVPQHAMGEGNNAGRDNSHVWLFERTLAAYVSSWEADPVSPKFGEFDHVRTVDNKDLEYATSQERFDDMMSGFRWVLRKDSKHYRKQINFHRMQQIPTGSGAALFGHRAAKISGMWINDAKRIKSYPSRSKALRDMNAFKSEKAQDMAHTEMVEFQSDVVLPISVDNNAETGDDDLAESEEADYMIPSRGAVRAARKSLGLAEVASAEFLRWFMNNYDHSPVSSVIISIDSLQKTRTREGWVELPSLSPYVTMKGFIASGDAKNGIVPVQEIAWQHVSARSARSYHPDFLSECKSPSPNVVSPFAWRFPFTIENGLSDNTKVDYVYVTVGARQKGVKGTEEKVPSCPLEESSNCACPKDEMKCANKGHDTALHTDYGFFINLYERTVLPAHYDAETNRHYPVEGASIVGESIKSPVTDNLSQCGLLKEGTVRTFKFEKSNDVMFTMSVSVLGTNMKNWPLVEASMISEEAGDEPPAAVEKERVDAEVTRSMEGHVPPTEEAVDPPLVAKEHKDADEEGLKGGDQVSAEPCENCEHKLEQLRTEHAKEESLRKEKTARETETVMGKISDMFKDLKSFIKQHDIVEKDASGDESGASDDTSAVGDKHGEAESGGEAHEVTSPVEASGEPEAITVDKGYILFKVKGYFKLGLLKNDGRSVRIGKRGGDVSLEATLQDVDMIDGIRESMFKVEEKKVGDVWVWQKHDADDVFKCVGGPDGKYKRDSDDDRIGTCAEADRYDTGATDLV